MNKTKAEALAFFQGIKGQVSEGADFGLAVPFTALDVSLEHAGSILVAAQNVHFAANGAYTGEVSVGMLAELGVQYVVIGHSERRQYFGETDESVNLKAHALVEASMTPILCIGESLDDFEKGQTEAVVRSQVALGLKDLSKEAVSTLVLAYEPVWAIGTGRSATALIAQDTCALVRDEVAQHFGTDVAEKVRIQYGGSVKAENIKEYLSQEDIDGALIGGASLEVDSFIAIMNALS